MTFTCANDEQRKTMAEFVSAAISKMWLKRNEKAIAKDRLGYWYNTPREFPTKSLTFPLEGVVQRFEVKTIAATNKKLVILTVRIPNTDVVLKAYISSLAKALAAHFGSREQADMYLQKFLGVTDGTAVSNALAWTRSFEGQDLAELNLSEEDKYKSPSKFFHSLREGEDGYTYADIMFKGDYNVLCHREKGRVFSKTEEDGAVVYPGGAGVPFNPDSSVTQLKHFIDSNMFKGRWNVRVMVKLNYVQMAKGQTEAGETVLYPIIKWSALEGDIHLVEVPISEKDEGMIKANKAIISNFNVPKKWTSEEGWSDASVKEKKKRRRTKKEAKPLLSTQPLDLDEEEDLADAEDADDSEEPEEKKQKTGK